MSRAVAVRNPPRLLFLVTEDWYFISHRLPMARAASAAGFEVHVACRVDKHAEAIRSEGFRLHPLEWRREERSPAALLGELRKVRTLMREIRPALAHQIAVKPTLFGSLAATGLRLPTVNSVAGLGYGFLAGGVKGRALRTAMTTLFKVILNRPAVLTVVQNPDDLAAMQALGIPPGKLRLIPGSGLPLEDFPVLPEPADPVTFGFAARMLKDKGVVQLVEAFRLVRARGLDVRLLLAGDTDPANPASLDAAAMQEIAALPGVKWLGHVSDIRSLWRECHVAVLPSRREGMPRALLEAAASGRPMIATDVPGCRELVREDVNGALVPYGDARALADTMERFARYPALRAHLGAGARRSVEQTYSGEAVGKAIVSVYQEVLASRASTPAMR